MNKKQSEKYGKLEVEFCYFDHKINELKKELETSDDQDSLLDEIEYSQKMKEEIFQEIKHHRVDLEGITMDEFLDHLIFEELIS